MLYSVSPYDIHDTSRHERMGKKPFILGLAQKKDDKQNTIKPSVNIMTYIFPWLGPNCEHLCCTYPATPKTCMDVCKDEANHALSGFPSCAEAVKTNQWAHVYTLEGGQ